MDHFGRLHIVEAIADVLDGGDEGFRTDHFGIEDHERGVHLSFGVEVDVRATVSSMAPARSTCRTGTSHWEQPETSTTPRARPIEREREKAAGEAEKCTAVDVIRGQFNSGPSTSMGRGC